MLTACAGQPRRCSRRRRLAPVALVQALLLFVVGGRGGGLAAGAPEERAATKPQEARGGLAVVNIGSSSGAPVAIEAGRVLKAQIGGWARQPELAAHLAGAPLPGASSPTPTPTGEAVQDITRLLARVRSERAPSGATLASLGQLLGVDYLLCVTAGGKGFEARLFSVHRQTFAPQGFEAPVEEAPRLVAFVRDQTKPPPAPARRTSVSRWVILGIAAALGAVALGLAISSSKAEGTGDLKVRITR
jgi:hypothetical protein